MGTALERRDREGNSQEPQVGSRTLPHRVLESMRPETERAYRMRCGPASGFSARAGFGPARSGSRMGIAPLCTTTRGELTMARRSLLPEAVDQYLTATIERENPIQRRLRAETSKMAEAVIGQRLRDRER